VLFFWVRPAPAHQTTVITAGKDSLAGKLLQGKKTGFAFVGASLLANRFSQRASPQTNIRRQASSYKGKSQVLPL
jgi:hypothetical protein